MPIPPRPDNSLTPVSLTDQVLTQSQSSREVIQDFVPLAESLEWDLGQQYLRERGNKAFISDSSPIPFVINNDGTLSRNAAEVFFASLVEAEEAGTLDGSGSTPSSLARHVEPGGARLTAPPPPPLPADGR